MKFIDISWPLISGMTTYKNRDDFSASQTKEWPTHGYRESRMCCGSHVGTHIDAPAHFLETGASIESVRLEHLIGPCTVLDFTHVQDAITDVHLASKLITTSRVLLKTKNSAQADDAPFNSQFVYLSQAGARYLRQACASVHTPAKSHDGVCQTGIACVGIDYLGIERNQPDHPTHKVLLGAGIAVLEGLRLDAVKEGTYDLICLPLAVVGLEAAPARAVLRLPDSYAG